MSNRLPRDFKIFFIDEGYGGYAVVSGMHQEQVLPFIRNQTVTLHVREVLPGESQQAAPVEPQRNIDWKEIWKDQDRKRERKIHLSDQLLIQELVEKQLAATKGSGEKC